jgi:hypothetical protein
LTLLLAPPILLLFSFYLHLLCLCRRQEHRDELLGLRKCPQPHERHTERKDSEFLREREREREYVC